MRRAFPVGVLAALALAVAAPAAAAAPPSLGPLSATNIQGVSALLAGSVDPGGLPTTYRFEHVEEATFLVSGFATATTTPPAEVDADVAQLPARAAIAGLSPDTAYRYRIVAVNSSGTTPGAPAGFVTTHGFGFLPGDEGFAVTAYADGGGEATRIGSHPYALALDLGFNLGGEFEGQPGAPFPDGDLRDLRIEMPPGLVLNPKVVSACTPEEFHTARSSPFEEASRSGEDCPDRSQIGTVDVHTSVDGNQVRRFGLFNLEPAPGVAAQFGFAPFGSPIVLDAVVAPSRDGSYALSLSARNFPQALDVHRLELSFWGAPWGASHNGERGDCLNEAEPGFPWAKCSPGEPLSYPPQAFLTLPSACSQSFAFEVAADAWQQPSIVTRAGGQGTLGDCNSLPFGPEPVGELTTTKASSSSGFRFVLQNDNTGLLDPGARASSQTKTAVVYLPDGVTINPSVGAGLGACAPAQYARETATSPQGAGCPNDSKIGAFTVRTPLADELFEGVVYLAQPDDPTTAAAGAENPFDTLVAVYLVAKLPDRGTMVTLPGKVVPDPATGRLTATFERLPQFPYTKLDIELQAGQRALLVSPPSCGPAVTRTDLHPWAGTQKTTAFSVSQISSGIDGGSCPSGRPPLAPAVVAGGVNSNVNSYTPYFVHITRRDPEQEIVSYSLVLPKGITGKLAGIPFCPDAAIARARERQGVAETENPSCSEASLVGHTSSGYGVGPALTYAGGRIYLAGPYNGAPLSLVTINAATVGPFDLGTIVIRSAFDIDPLTAQLRIDSRASDPIPHILDGVPVHLRDVRVYMDRPEFTHNPSSCAPSQLTSTVGGAGALLGDRSDDELVDVSVPFQLLNCRTLGFRPRLGIRLRGGTRRASYPELRVTFAARGQGDSNLKDIAVTIPRQMFVAQNHIRGICTLPQFAAERCPAESVYGSAVARTPLLDEPMRGKVYLRSAPSHRLPDLVASLYSGSVHIVLEGRIGPGRKGGIRAFFKDLPDQPVDRFTMTLFGGKRGLLVNSADVCATPPVSTVKALAQNNLGAVFTTRLRGNCGKGKR
jgi:hypothetical protein